jgi:NosR/NirI family nitrous oxide reductase transcriptional regulator
MVKQEMHQNEAPLPSGTGLWGWLWQETLFHLFPWGPGFFQQRLAIQAASIALAVAVTVAWILAATGRIGSAMVIAWWIGWSLYEVLCRRRCKPFIKEGPWWGKQWRRASTADLISYVATKNLLIGIGLFLVLALLGTFDS